MKHRVFSLADPDNPIHRLERLRRYVSREAMERAGYCDDLACRWVGILHAHSLVFWPLFDELPQESVKH
jgi:hypothetical protein